jgi:acetolactate synthase regulatory subunit
VSNLTADADDFAKICSQNLLSSLKPVYSVGSQLQKVTDLEEINVLSLTKQISEFKP